MKDWVQNMSPEERAEWEEFVRHYREEVLGKMEESAFVMSLIPPGKTDIKFAVELGMAIMLDKPIIAVTLPGATCPPKLRMVADKVIEVDIEREEGRKVLMEEIQALMADEG